MPHALGVAAQCLIIFNGWQLKTDPHVRHRSPGERNCQECTWRRAAGEIQPKHNYGGGDKQSLGRSSVKYAQAIQRLCIIERSKWEQDEYHGSLIVNVFTVSGKTAVRAKGGGGEEGAGRVKCKAKYFLWLFLSSH